MPDCGKRPDEENKRRLETASYRDPPNNYGAQMLQRSLPPQQQQQQQSGGRKKAGGIMRLPNYRGWTVNIRAPKWKDNQLWMNSEDYEAAQYIADAAFHFTGRLPVHFPGVKFEYLPLRLSTGERLTTRNKCSAYVAKIAKGPALLDRRKDFKERAQKLILEMVRRSEVVRFLSTVRASPRQAWQPRPEADPDGTDSPFTDDENGTAMEVDTPSEEAIQAVPSTVAVNPSLCGGLVPVADDGEGENETPLEFDSLSEEAIQTLAPTGTADAAALFQFDSIMTSFSMDVDWSSAFIPSFEMDLDEPENFLTSGAQSLEIWHPRSGEKEKEDLVPDNCKEFLASLDGDEEVCKSIGPPRAPFVPHSPLLATSPGSGW